MVKGACMAKGGVVGVMHGGGVYCRGGMHGRGGCMVGVHAWGHAW